MSVSTPRPSALFVTLGAALLAPLAACAVSSGNGARAYGGGIERPDHALRTASEDLGCPPRSLHIVTTLERRYSNTSTARYVIEGCGERALYVEQCEMVDETPAGPGFQIVETGMFAVRCRYLIVSRLSVAPRAAASGSVGAGVSLP